jgi:uncharacterized membrane protein
MFLTKYLRLFIGLLALLGLGIMVYLTYIHYANIQSFCDISQEVSCDVVTTSIYSEIFGLPVSVLGIFYFAYVFWASLFNKKRAAIKNIFLLTLFVLLPSLYLTLVEVFFIESICILCETSKALMFAVLILSFFEMRRGEVTLRLLAPVVIAGVVVAGLTYFAQVGNVAREDWSELVSCLNEKGVVYYKSVKCPNCRRQEQLLGVAYQKLNSVECHPEGENPQVELCFEKKVNKTPSFLLEKDGKEIKRLEGLTQVKDLAAFAGCPI